MKLESNKIIILKTLIENMNSETLKFIRCYAMRVYNDCHLLTYSRGMKDIDNNYYLLRIKDFLSDLYFCIFTGRNVDKNKNELITIQDVFIMMHLVTETGKIWISIKNYDNRNDIAKKIECILNYLKVKPNEMCIFVNQDLEYYNYLVDYFDFYLDKFVKDINKTQNIEKMDIMKNNITEKKNVEKNNETNNDKNINKNDNTIVIDNNKESNSMNIFIQNQNNISNVNERKNSININNNINANIGIEEKAQNLLSVLFLLNDVNFRADHERTKHLILNIIKIIDDIGEEDIEKQIEVLDAFYNLKHKENLNKKILNEIQILYINSLIQQNKLDDADTVIKNSLKLILPNTKEELLYFILNFYLLLQRADYDRVKLGEMFKIVIQHQELKLEDLNELFIHIYNHEYKYYLLKLFCEEICNIPNNNNQGQNRNKNKSEINNRNNADNNKYLNSKIEMSFNVLTSMPEFVLIFNYLFIEAFINSQESEFNNDPNGNDRDFYMNDKDIENILNNENFFELMKIMSEALLENSINNFYKEHAMNIPILLHNLVYIFLNKAKNVHQNNFANYFLIDIINKYKKNNINEWKEFSLMSIQLYIEKKNYDKLKTILKELEADEKEVKHSTYIFAKIISILGEGIKWNSINSIEQLCQALNESEDFEILYYIKIFRFIYDNKINDIFLLSIILEKYCNKNIEIYNNYDTETNPLNQLKYVNYNYSMIDCCYEVLFYCSHFSNFCSKIDAFCDILENICVFMENFKYESNNIKNKIIITNISVVSELIKLFISFKNLKDFKTGKYCFPDYMISYISKLLNFVFFNFKQFLCEEYLQNLNCPITYESLKPVTMLFSFFQNSKIFSFSLEIKDLVNEKMKEKDIINKYTSLKDKYKLYQQNFVNAIKIYTNVIQEYDNNSNNNCNNNKDDENKIIIEEEKNLIKPKINDYLTNIYNETKIYDEIIMIKLTINSEKDNLKNDITNIINKNYHDKRFMMIVNSVLFCEGFKNLCFYLINELINKIIVTNTDELFNKCYSTNDIFELYKELYNVSDENDIQIQIKSLKNYQIFLCKLNGKIDDSVFYQNTEWIYYQVFQIIEKSGTNLDKKTMNFINLKSIFDEINNVLIGKEKTLVIEGLIDLIIKKTI